MIQPIRMHGSYEGIEKAAFNMADGEISQVIPAGGQYVIIKRESLIPARDYKMDEVAGQLEEVIREGKMRKVANDVFQQLKDNAKLEIVWGDPVKQQKTPGVAALINGEPITIRDLALECIDRHGTEVLEVIDQSRPARSGVQKTGHYRFRQGYERGDRPGGVAGRKTKARRLARRRCMDRADHQRSRAFRWKCIATTPYGPRRR